MRAHAMAMEVGGAPSCQSMRTCASFHRRLANLRLIRQIGDIDQPLAAVSVAMNGVIIGEPQAGEISALPIRPFKPTASPAEKVSV